MPRCPEAQLALGLGGGWEKALEPGALRPVAPPRTPMPSVLAWPDDLRALTLTNPWGWAMTRAPKLKRVENRDWPPFPAQMSGHWFMLHAGVAYEKPKWIRWIADRAGATPPTREELRRRGEVGALLAFARVLRVVTSAADLDPDQRPWLMKERKYGWVLDVRPLEKPVPYIGFQKLWRVQKHGFMGVPNGLALLQQEFDRMKLSEAA